MKRVLIFTSILFIIFSMNSCQTVVDESIVLELYKKSLKPNLAGLLGVIIDSNNDPVVNEVVRLGEVVWNNDKSVGNFIIDGAHSPSTITDENGIFVFLNIEPIEYVIVVRNVDVNPVIIPELDDSNKAAIYSPGENEILDVGILYINALE